MNDYLAIIEGIREDIELNGRSEVAFRNSTEILTAVKHELEKRGLACDVVIIDKYPVLITTRM